MESSARRRLSGVIVATALAIATGAGAAKAADGTFALLGGAPKIVARFSATYGAGNTVTVKIRQFLLDGATPILKYDADMQKLMHIIVVRDDFATFAHVHPGFDAASGTFTQVLRMEPKHRYYVYADTTPHGVGQQVFRFPIGLPYLASRPSSSASPKSVAAGPYTVTLAGTTLQPDRATNLALDVYENGKPARDLSTYLGAAAHAVFVNTLTLEYVHVHPAERGAPMAMGANETMEMPARTGAGMQIPVPPLSPGVYKLWIEFRGEGGGVYTAPFTMLVR